MLKARSKRHGWYYYQVICSFINVVGSQTESDALEVAEIAAAPPFLRLAPRFSTQLIQNSGP